MKHKNSLYRLRRYAVGTVSLIFKLGMAVFFLFPFYWMITTSLKTYRESIRFPPTLFPESPSLQAFLDVWQRIDIPPYFWNSFLVALSVVLLQAVINVPAAYGFARYEFKGKKYMLALVMLAFMIPTQITFIPVYIMFSKLRLLKTLVPQILPFAANAYGIFLMRQSFMQVPDELVEAASMDNAGELRIMFRVMLPMSKGSIITAELFSFISTWNSYFWPLIMTTKDTFRTLPIGVAMLNSQEGGRLWHVLMAGNMFLVVPILAVYLIANKQIRKAFAYSGIK